MNTNESGKGKPYGAFIAQIPRLNLPRQEKQAIVNEVLASYEKAAKKIREKAARKNPEK